MERGPHWRDGYHRALSLVQLGRSLVATFGERAIDMMWKGTGINAVVLVTSVIWILAVAWLIGDALWQGLPAL